MEALIVSTDEEAIHYLSVHLNNKNIEVSLAANNKSAVEIIGLRRPWVVFADIKGRGIDALSIYKAVEKAHPEVSMVGLARKFDAEEAIQLLRKGLRDYLALPVKGQQDLLQKAIHRARGRASGVVSYMQAHDDLEEKSAGIDEELSQLKEDQEAGRYVQLKLFPKNPLQLGSFQFSHRIFPSLYLSGDYIDYFPIDDKRSFFYFSDVSGHGASSAFITVMLKTLSHRWAQDRKREGGLSPANYISFINKELLKTNTGKHMTLFCGILDEKENTLVYSLAAHFPKPRYRNGKKFFTIEENALPVGVFPDAGYPENTIKMEENFALYLFSDGIMEIIEGSGLSEKERKLKNNIDKSGTDIEEICQSFKLGDGHELPDDIGILLIQRIQA